MTLPIEELIGFLKQADNYTQDTRNWPDPTEPRASKPPEAEGCTCQQGLKLECPIHGLNADPELQELDHSWSMPQAQPIGYQQDGPRNWTQAISRFSPRDGHAIDAGDTNTQANQKNQRDPSPSSSVRDDVSRFPSQWKVRDHRQSRRFVPFGIEELNLPKLSSFTVGNGQSELIEIPGQRVDVENGFLPFGPLQQVGPVMEHLKDDPKRVSRRFVDGSSFSVHSSTPPIAKEFVVNPEPEDHSGNCHHKSEDESNRPQGESSSARTDHIEDHTKPSNEISQSEEISADQASNTAHKWSVTRIGLKIRPYKPGKYGKGMIQSEEAPEAQIWRVRGWNGSPHHDQVKEALGVVRPLIAFHIDKQGVFYFHQEDEGFVSPKDPGELAQQVEKQYPELKWGHKSAEEYDEDHNQNDDGATHTAAMSQLTQVIASMQTPKEPRRLVIHRDHEGRMASIEEVPIP